MSVFRQARGITRSLLMYYGRPAQVRCMARFYAQFIHPGDLAFDVGAHVGSRIPAWQRLGARIVAVEPLPSCAWLLRCVYGRQRNVRLVQQAVGSGSGAQTMLLCERE